MAKYLISDKVIKINKANIIRAVFEEMANALENDLNYMWDSIFINLFEVEGRYVMDKDDTFLVDDGHGEPEELMCEEIEELICRKIMVVRSMIERSLDASDDSMILVWDE